ncbi:MAG: hypothetical protein P8163_20385, partial [Candidatus Thiodiazotropha sp.]
PAGDITIEAIFFKIGKLLVEWSGQLIFLGLKGEKIVGHWNTVEAFPPQSEWKDNNGSLFTYSCLKPSSEECPFLLES